MHVAGTADVRGPGAQGLGTLRVWLEAVVRAQCIPCEAAQVRQRVAGECANVDEGGAMPRSDNAGRKILIVIVWSPQDDRVERRPPPEMTEEQRLRLVVSEQPIRGQTSLEIRRFESIRGQEELRPDSRHDPDGLGEMHDLPRAEARELRADLVNA